MYEHRSEPLLSRAKFLRRVVLHALVAFGLIAISWTMGILGYHFFGNLAWIDAILNASMILGGMGPVDVLRSNAGKLFASFYALYSGIAFLVTAGIVVAPLAHRLLHRLHLEAKEDQDRRG